jgi:peptidoglycan/LPS O-acetylase OafA/YrhL
VTARRAADLVLRWVRFYTRQLPDAVAERRVEELAADVHDHIAHERGRGTSDRRIALSILSRMARGVPADLAWRQRVRRSEGDFVKPFVAILAAALVVAAIAFVADSPAILLLSIAVIAADIVGMFALGLRTAQRGDFVKPFLAILVAALGVAAIGVSAIVVGERGDAPGLMLLGVVLITSVVVGAFAFGMRTAQRSN